MLFAAAIAAVKRDEKLVTHFMSKVAAGALSVEQVDSACVGVLNSRGVVPAHYNVVPTIAPHAKQSADNVDVASARAYFEGHFGSVPNFVELLAENSPPALEGFFLMRRATLMETPMPNKMMELLLCAVNAAEFQARFVAIHAREPVELVLRKRN